MSDTTRPVQSMRAMLDVSEVERELLGTISVRRAKALGLLAQAERDWTLAGAGMAAARGLRPETVDELTETGLVISLAASTNAANAANAAPTTGVANAEVPHAE